MQLKIGYISKDLELQSNHWLCNAFLEVAVLQMPMRKIKGNPKLLVVT